MNIIEDFIKGCETDAPLEFKEATIYHALSYLPGRFISYKGRRPNIWFLLSSIPGAYRRSSVNKIHDTIRKTALMDYYNVVTNVKPTKMIKEKNPKTKKMEEKEVPKQPEEIRDEKRQKVFRNSNINEYIQSGSPEGVVDKIVYSSKKGINTFCINDSEFGLTLKNVSGSNYTSGIDTLYSKLYSGEEYLQDLSKRGEKAMHWNIRHIHAGTYVTMFCSMQEPRLYLRRASFEQGLMRRIILIYVSGYNKKIDFKDYRSLLDVDNKQESTNMYYIGKKLGAMMLDYKRRQLDFEPQQGFLRIIKRLNYSVDMKAREDPCIENIFRLSAPEHIFKLGMLNAISRNQIENNKLISTADDINKALNFYNRATKNFDEVVDQVGIIIKDLEVDPGIEKVMRLLKRYDVLSRTDLMRKTHIKKDKLDPVLEHLIVTKLIKVYSDKGKTIYKLTHV